MNEWTYFESWLAWGLPACQSLSVKQKDALNQTLEGPSEQSEILISTTHPYGTRAPPPPCWQSLDSSYLLQSQRALHAFRPIPYLPAATAMILRGWRSSVPPQGFGTPQNSPRPDVPGPSENMANLMEGPHLPISPFLKNQRFSLESVRYSESLDTMKPEKGLAAIPRPLLLGSFNKWATFLPVCLLRGGGKFFLQTYVQWDTGHPKLFLMFLE